MAVKLESVAKLAKTAIGLEKRSQTAVLRVVGEAVKSLGPPAFPSGIMAAALARLAKEESDLSKQHEWQRQAEETLREKVQPEFEAALAALAPVPPKREASEDNDLDEAEKVAAEAKLAEQMRMLRIDQADKERSIRGFVGGVAVEVAEAAVDTGNRMDLLSIMAAKDEEMHCKGYLPFEILVVNAFRWVSRCSRAGCRLN